MLTQELQSGVCCQRLLQFRPESPRLKHGALKPKVENKPGLAALAASFHPRMLACRGQRQHTCFQQQQCRNKKPKFINSLFRDTSPYFRHVPLSGSLPAPLPHPSDSSELQRERASQCVSLMRG